MAQKQTEFDSGQALLTGAPKAPVQGLMQELQKFQQKSAIEHRQQNKLRLEEQAMNDARESIAVGGDLPKTEHKFLRKDLTEAYNSAARKVYQVKDNRMIQEAISREEFKYMNNELGPMTATQFDQHIREVINPAISEMHSNPALGPEYAAGITASTEIALDEAKGRLVDEDLKREQIKLNEANVEIARSLVASLTDDNINPDVPHARINKVNFRSMKSVRSWFEDTQDDVASVERVIDGMIQTFGDSPELTKHKRYVNDTVRKDMAMKAIVSLVDSGRVTDANGFIKFLRDGGVEYFDDNIITKFERIVQDKTARELTDSQLRNKQLNPSDMEQAANANVGLKGGGGRWESVITTNQKFTTLLDGLDNGLLDINRKKELSHIANIARKELAQAEAILPGTLEALKKRTDLHPVWKVIIDEGIHKDVVWKGQPLERWDQSKYTSVKKFQDNVRTEMSSVVLNNEAALYDLHMPSYAAKTDPKNLDAAMNTPSTTGLSRSKEMEELLVTEFRAASEIGVNFAGMNIDQKSAARLKSDPQLSPRTQKNVAGYTMTVLERYLHDGGVQNQEALMDWVSSTQRAAERHTAGRATNFFTYLTNADERMRPYASSLNLIGDLIATGNSELASHFADLVLRSPNESLDLADLPQGFPNREAFFANSKVREIDEVVSAYNFGMRDDSVIRALYDGLAARAISNPDSFDFDDELKQLGEKLGDERRIVETQGKTFSKIAIPVNLPDKARPFIPRLVIGNRGDDGVGASPRMMAYAHPLQVQTIKEGGYVTGRFTDDGKMAMFVVDTSNNAKPFILHSAWKSQGVITQHGNTSLDKSDLFEPAAGKQMVIDLGSSRFQPAAASQATPKLHHPVVKAAKEAAGGHP